MADDPPPREPQALPEALRIWLQIGGMLIGICLFGWLIFRFTRGAHLGS